MRRVSEPNQEPKVITKAKTVKVLRSDGTSWRSTILRTLSKDLLIVS
jgi:hypothetical protein